MFLLQIEKFQQNTNETSWIVNTTAGIAKTELSTCQNYCTVKTVAVTVQNL